MSSEVRPSARRPAVIPSPLVSKVTVTSRPLSTRSQSPLALGQQGHCHPSPLLSRVTVTPRPWSAGSKSSLALCQQGHSHPSPLVSKVTVTHRFAQQDHIHPSPVVSNFTVTTRPWCRQSQSPHDLGVNNVGHHSSWC